jgi:hypothetical protein
MTVLKSIVLVALIAGAFAAPLKQKLAQQNAGCDIPVPTIPVITLPECTCNFTVLPGLGAGINQGQSEEATVVQQSLLSTVPDTQFSQICQSNCCECAEEAHSSFANQQKNRTFSISGSIQVLENLYLQENGQAAEQSYGRAEKDSICQRNNAQGGLGAGLGCTTVSACPAPLGSH